jgi:tetratricopeptide (TPR) repeat protein
MNKKRICCIGFLILVAVTLAGCASGKKQYDAGMQLKESGKYREAIAVMEEAIAVEPKNEEYRIALADLKNALINELIAEADNALRSETPLTVDTINRAKTKIEEAEQVDRDHPAVVDFRAKLKKEEDAFLSNVKKLYAQVKGYITKEQWLKAYADLQEIQNLFPDYEDSARLMQQVSDKGAQAVYLKGKKLFDQENYRQSVAIFRQALSLKAGHQPSKELLALALKRDTKEYFLEQGQKALDERQWDRAEKAYRRALSYDPEDEALKRAVANVKYKASLFYVRESRSHMFAGWLFTAFESYNQAVLYSQNSNQTELQAIIGTLGDELATQAGLLTDQFSGAGHYGSALFWYQKIMHVEPEYPGIFYRIQAMEDEIKQRIRKSIAVFDFEPPSNSPDAGAIFANNLITHIFKSASKDIKILERENLQSILEEMKLGQMGVVSSKTAKEMGRVYGIDVAVMGSVLRYNVDSTSYSDTKTVTYQVKKAEKNIDYLNWKARNPNPTKEQLEQAPIPYIHTMVDVEKEYNVSTHKKVAFVTVSFRIVDVKTGENILVDTIPRTKTAKDDTSAGVQIAGIKFDPLEIPTDTELLQELTTEVVAELGREALQPLKNLEKTYYDLGEKYKERRDGIQAAEYYMDAIFDEKVKRIPDSSLSRQANLNLDEIFRNYKVRAVE